MILTNITKFIMILCKEIIVTKYLKHCDYFHFYKNCFDTGPIDFLNYIKTADLIIATSFHACVFSAIFHKPFIAVDVENDNRIQGFLETYHLQNHNLNTKSATYDEIIQKSKLVDFEYFDLELKQTQSKAFNWFSEILNDGASK